MRSLNKICYLSVSSGRGLHPQLLETSQDVMRKNLSAAPIEQRRPGEAQRLPGCPGEGRPRHQELPCAAGLPGLAFPNEEFPPHRNPPSIAGRAWSAELQGANHRSAVTYKSPTSTHGLPSQRGVTQNHGISRVGRALYALYAPTPHRSAPHPRRAPRAAVPPHPGNKPLPTADPNLPGAAFGRCSPPCLTAGRPFGYRPAAPGSAL